MRHFLALFFVICAGATVQAQLADGYLETWLSNRTQQLESQFSIRPFDSIGWAETIQHAAAVARKNDRPIFLFTLDGHMDTGRC